MKISAEETRLTVIDPLEIPRMVDCNVHELKRQYGGKIALKGNLHTTDVMLRGSVNDVVRAAKQAIDGAALGGRFILSTIEDSWEGKAVCLSGDKRARSHGSRVLVSSGS